MLPIMEKESFFCAFNGIDGANINNARCSSQLQPLDSCACLEEPPMGARKEASSQAARRASLTWLANNVVRSPAQCKCTKCPEMICGFCGKHSMDSAAHDTDDP